MNCKLCHLTPPPEKCNDDCDLCEFCDPEIPYPCCTCLRWEAEQMTSENEFENWIKSEVELYNRIVHQGPLNKYTPQGYQRLIKVHAIASRMSEKLIQKKIIINSLDKALQERINHYTTLYRSTLRYATADNQDTLEDILTETHEILHQLMLFFNDHFELNYNLETQTETKAGPEPDRQLSTIKEAIEKGERAKPC